MDIDKEKYKVLDAKSIEVIHWRVNPGLAINELVLGQRIPEVLLIDKTSDKPMLERGYVPCPHCGTLHSGLTWSQQNHTVFNNWYGYFCPNCEQIIPCVRNWTASLILLLLWPLRFWNADERKQRWLDKQPSRFANLTFGSVKVNWMKMGLKWGFFMFIALGIGLPALFPLFIEEITYDQMLDIRFILAMIAFTLPVCALAGLLFGFMMKKSMEKKGVPIQGSDLNHK